MTSGPAACPFCNAPLPPLAVPPATAKLPCPRCGEPLPAQHWPVGPGAPRPVASAPPLPQAKRRTLAVILGLMGCMALLGLSYALYTADVRKTRHPWPRVQPEPLAVKSPAELPALGYLPPNVSLIAGIHFAALGQDPVGKKLLEEPQPQVVGLAVKLLRSVGLKLDEIDHVAAALVEGRPAPEVVVIARTRSPYNLEKVAAVVQPTRMLVHHKRPLYHYANQLFGETVLWAADEQTLICVLRSPRRPEAGGADVPLDELLPGIPPSPRPAEAALSPSLRPLLTERLARQSLLWCVGDVEQGQALALVLAALPARGWRPAVAVKQFAVGVFPHEGLTLLGALSTGEEKAARALQSQYEGLALPAGVTLKATAPPAGEAPWVTVQVRAGAEEVREMLGKVAPAVK